jgi:hypothetical protein
VSMTGTIDRVGVVTSVSGDGAGRRKERQRSYKRLTRPGCQCRWSRAGMACPQPTVSLAAALRRGRVVGWAPARRWPGVRVPRPAAASWQEDLRERDPARRATTGTGTKRLLREKALGPASGGFTEDSRLPQPSASRDNGRLGRLPVVHSPSLLEAPHRLYTCTRPVYGAQYEAEYAIGGFVCRLFGRRTRAARGIVNSEHNCSAADQSHG